MDTVEIFIASEIKSSKYLLNAYNKVEKYHRDYLLKPFVSGSCQQVLLYDMTRAKISGYGLVKLCTDT